MAVILLARTAWPFPQLRALTVGSAIVFLALMGTALHRVWKVHQMAYSKALAGDQVLTQTLNATIWAYQWANTGFALLAFIGFQFSLVVK